MIHMLLMDIFMQTFEMTDSIDVFTEVIIMHNTEPLRADAHWLTQNRNAQDENVNDD